MATIECCRPRPASRRSTVSSSSSSRTRSNASQKRPRDIMTTHHIGRIVVGCLTSGLVVALALVIGPVAGAQEHVITGTILLTFAASWALLGALSMLWTEQPQRWAFA